MVMYAIQVSTELAKFMVGHEVSTESLQNLENCEEEVLRLDRLTVEKKFRNISLTVRKGEILGVTGLLEMEELKYFKQYLDACRSIVGKFM